jgi:hypothetical protein
MHKQTLSGRPILVVEDEPLIALDILVMFAPPREECDREPVHNP